MLTIAGQSNEKATITLTVDLVGNRPLEENRQTKSAKFSLRTIVWIRGSHRETNRTNRFAEGTKTNSQNGHYVRSDKKNGESSLRTDIRFTLGVCDVASVLYPYYHIIIWQQIKNVGFVV